MTTFSSRCGLGCVCALLVAGCFSPDAIDGLDGDDADTDASSGGDGNDDGDSSGEGDSTGSDTDAGEDPTSGTGPGEGQLAFALDGGLWLMAAQPGAEPRALGPELDALAPGLDDPFVQISRDGGWLLFSSERFDSACIGYTCLTRAPVDLSDAAVVRGPDQQPIRSSDGAAIGTGGTVIVFTAEGGPHVRDLWRIDQDGDLWTAPVLLTGDSPYAFNTLPQIDEPVWRVAFDCGDEPYAAEGTAVCEVAIDATGFVVLWSPAQAPAGLDPGGALHHPSYTASGGVVFEASWGGEQIWVLEPGAAEPTLLRADHFNDNTPCALPDGRIASLWLGNPDGAGLHELELKSADGATADVLLPGRDVFDAVLGCSR
jgi:hypothetical protein